MANTDKVVNIVFQGDDRVSKTIQGIGSSMGQLETVIGGIADPLAKIGDGVLKADAALAAFAVGGMALALRESGRFGDSFAEISTLIGGTTGDIEAFRGEIKEYGKDSTSSLENINSAIYTAISAGIDYRDAIEAVARSERLAVAGKADLEATTRLLASTLNAYGESTDQAARYSDVFFNTVKLGQTTIPELADGLSQVTGIASSAEIPIETLAASIAALTATGAPTTQAITQIRGAIAAIIKPSSDAAALAEDLGIEFNAAALQSKGFEGILREVYSATDGNVDIMARLFGRVEGLNAALILGADSSGKFKGALESMGSAAGAVDAAFAKMAENFDLINQSIVNNVQLLLISIGDNLRAGYSDVAGGLKDMLEAVAESVDAGAFDPLFDAFDDFAAKAGDTMRVIAENLPEALEMVDWSEFIRALQDLAVEFGAVFDEVDVSTPKGLGEAIQAVVDTIESLIRVTQGMVAYLKPVWESLQEGIGRFNDLDDQAKISAGEILGAAELVARAGVKIGMALVAIKESGADIERVFNVVIGSIQLLWGGAQAAFSGLVVLLAEYLDKFFAFTEYLSNFPGLGRFKDDIQDIRNALQETSEEWQDVLFDASDAAREGLGKVFGSVADEADNATKAIQGTSQATSELGDTSNLTVSAVGHNADEIRRILEEMSSGSRDAITGDMQAISDEIEQAVPEEKTMAVVPTVDAEKTEEAKKALADMGKELELQVKRDIAVIDAETRRYETLIGARVRAIEADADVAKELTRTSASNYAETSEAYTKTVEILSGTGPYSAARYDMLGQLEKQNSRLNKQVDSQVELEGAMARLMNARAEAIERGDAEIKISMDGIYPELEMIMWEVIKRVQIQANAEGSAFLLGI